MSGDAVLSREKALDRRETCRRSTSEHRYRRSRSTSEKFVSTPAEGALDDHPDYDTGIQTVIAGKADALFGDYLACAVAVWRHPGAGLSNRATPFTAEPLGIALRPTIRSS